MEIKEILKQRFTEKGLIDLKVKLNTSINFFNNKETIYPINEQILGFGKWIVDNELELLGRIIELAELTFTQIEIKKTEHDNGNIQMEIII